MTKKPIKRPAPRALRLDLLANAATITGEDRQAQYGDPALNRACIGELQMVIHKYLVSRGASTPEYISNLNMLAEKLGRAITSPRPGADTFTDGAAYFALAGEALFRRN